MIKLVESAGKQSRGVEKYFNFEQTQRESPVPYFFVCFFFIGWQHALFGSCGWQAYRWFSFSPTPFTVSQSSSLLLLFSKKCSCHDVSCRRWDNGRSWRRCNRRPAGRRMFRVNEWRGMGAIIEIGFIFDLFKRRRADQKREWGLDSKGSSSNVRLQCSVTAYYGGRIWPPRSFRFGGYLEFVFGHLIP